MDETDMDDVGDVDICRVCRLNGTSDRPLHYPCVCTGSIKYIHQECLVQWLSHSKKEYCELCSHKFTFKPVYSPDMPKSMPFVELLHGLGKNILRALRFWLHYTLVVVAWLGVVPITAYRIYKCLFAGSINSLMALPMDILSTENIFIDCMFGGLVVAVSVGGFIMLLWLREQIVIHGGPEWLTLRDDVFQLDLFLRNAFGNIDNINAQPVQQQQEHAANAPPLGDDAENAPPLVGFVENVVNEGADEDIENNAENHNDNEQNVPGDEGGWNPDAIMEDLTWDKFLGLDGSFIFLEHVFWIISLNTSFILVFTFIPYHIGQMLITLVGLEGKLTGLNFDDIIILFVGYLLIAFGLIFLHFILRYTSYRKLRRTVGLCYIVLKVALLMAVEIGLFPFVCGWWLDICSLPLFAITIKDRKESFIYAPVTAAFLHWLVGMLYVFYFAAFIIVLREIFRPGVLWFLRNINDPQFHPVREMIQLNVFRHSRRFILSLVVFGTTVLVIVWVPVQVIKRFTKGLIPFNVSLSSDAPISEMSLELLLLQVVLPAFLEQGHARKWLKGFIQYWSQAVAYVLGLRSYLFGDVDLKELNPLQIVHVDNAGKWQKGPVARGTALENPLEGVGSPTVRAYYRPKHFTLKMILLIAVMVVSFVCAAFTVFTVPVIIGRASLSFILGDVLVHELYTAATGCYIIWLFLRILTVLKSWYPVGFHTIYQKFKVILKLASKIFIAGLTCLGVVPLFLGVFFELVVVIPLRVPLDQTPLLYIWQDWALGVLHLKIMGALIMVGPEWWLRDAIDRVYRNGFVNMNLSHILMNIMYPIIITLLLAITVPYILTGGLLPLLGFHEDVVVFCLRRVYPVMMFTIVLIAAIIIQGKQFKALYEKIKNEKYLIGKVLVNYESNKKVQ